MCITEVFRRKGDKVVTIRPDETVAYVLARPNEQHIGALVIREDGRQTDLRMRHLPVVVDGELKAIVSIGAIVKNRLDDRGARPALPIRAAPVTARAARHLALTGQRERAAT